MRDLPNRGCVLRAIEDGVVIGFTVDGRTVEEFAYQTEAALTMARKIIELATRATALDELLGKGGDQ
jgi:hypothetical protein